MTEIYPGLYRGRGPSGLDVLVEIIPHLRSVAIGLWVTAGSRDDPPGKEGLAHLLEHMTFKGTASHSAPEIAQIIDTLGGHLNAATTNEYTFYHTEVLAEGLPTAVAILRELVTAPKIAPEDLQREQVVIGEEIRMIEDDPEDTAFRLLGENLWSGGHPLGQPVVGRLHSVISLRPEDLWGFFTDHYRPSRMILVACGQVEPGAVLTQMETFPSLPERDGRPLRSPPQPRAGASFAERDIQQVHVALGFPTVPIHAPERYGLEVLNAILGGSVSSRLFQRIREGLGLVYAVFSVTAYYTDAGSLAAYAATEEKNLPQVLSLLRAEICKLREAPPSASEVGRAVQRLQNAFLLSLDDPGSRMVRLGAALALGRNPLPPEEVVQRLAAVTPEEVQALAQRFLDPERAALAAVGPSAERLERLVRSYAEVT